MARDFKAEYARRLALGASRGESRQEARGHRSTPEHKGRASPVHTTPPDNRHGRKFPAYRVGPYPKSVRASRGHQASPKSVKRALSKTKTKYVRVAVQAIAPKSPKKKKKGDRGESVAGQRDLIWTSRVVNREELNEALDGYIADYDSLSEQEQNEVMIELAEEFGFGLQDVESVIGWQFMDSPDD